MCFVFSGAVRSGCSVDTCFEDDLDQDIENELKNEAEQVFHMAVATSPLFTS